MCFGVERVERLDGGRNSCCEHQEDKYVECKEYKMERLVPAEAWMHSSHNSLREYEVDEEQDQNTRASKDLRCDGDLDVVRIASPDDAHDAGDDSSHTEPKRHAGNEKLVAFV